MCGVSHVEELKQKVEAKWAELVTVEWAKEVANARRLPGSLHRRQRGSLRGQEEDSSCDDSGWLSSQHLLVVLIFIRMVNPTFFFVVVGNVINT